MLEQDLRDHLVFGGGCTTALFITDPVTLEDVRATDDIDLLVDLAGLAEWGQLLEQPRERRSPRMTMSSAECGSVRSKSISCRTMKRSSAVDG
ncbi:hypothetical protein [Rhizobium sp. GR12]|uniref:hypothetical protein n=1 Tax=Rhizobium sp. GR12 TaxID=3053925 RepID=UPI002FBD509D